MPRRLALPALTLVLFAAVPALSANATTAVIRTGNALRIAGDDSPNVVVADDDYVDGKLAIVVGDPSGGSVTPGGSCVALSASKVTCGAPGFGAALTVQLGPGDDNFRDDISDSSMTLDLDAGPGNDTIVGSMNNDILRGGDGNDRLYGMSGDDTIDGGAGDDTILGMAGNDKIVGGSGRDTLNGDGRTNDVTVSLYGNDTIDARDGEVDSVACELGADVVTADAADVVEGDCEQVDRAAAAAGGGAAGGLSVKVSGVKAPSLAAVLEGSAIQFQLTFSAPCSVAAGVVVPKASAKRLGLGSKDTLIGSAKATAQAGTYPASIKLSPRYRAKLRRAKSVPAAIAVVCAGADGRQVQDVSRVTLR